MLRALSEEGAEYLVVGAYALAAHGAPRATGDLDVIFFFLGVSESSWFVSLRPCASVVQLRPGVPRAIGLVI